MGSRETHDSKREFETWVRSISIDPVSLCIHVEKDKRVPINPTEQPHGSIITTVTSTAAAGQTVIDNPRRGEIIVHKRSGGQYYEESNIKRKKQEGQDMEQMGRCGKVRLDNYIGKERLSTNSSTAYGKKGRTSSSSLTATLRLHKQVEERRLRLRNGSTGSVRNDTKQSTSTNFVPQDAV
eukprot:768473-Hanusia_phi.AAC.6